MTGTYSCIRTISRRANIVHLRPLPKIPQSSDGASGVVRSFMAWSRLQPPVHFDNNSNINNTILETSSLSVSSSSWTKSSYCLNEKCNYHSSATVAFGGNNKEYPIHTLLPFPALSPTMEMGTISKWELNVGDTFTAGSVLCSIETDKATMDFEAQDDGVIAKILKDGPTAIDLPIGSPIAIIVDDIADVPAFENYVLEVMASATTTTTVDTAVAAAAPAVAVVTGGLSRTSVLLPSARFLAESRGLDATVLTGSGKGGRVTKGDVMAAIRDGTPMPALSVHETIAAPLLPKAVAATGAAVAAVPSSSLSSTIIMADLPLPPIDSYGTYADFANNNMRKVIARRLTESKRGVPHYYTSVEVELDNVMKLRKVLVNDHGIKISVNDVIIKCCSLALRDVPEVNGTYDPKTDTVKLQDSIDVSVAVATPTGLITPIVPHTDTLGLAEITDKIRDLATRARDGKLKPEEYQGGTFCVSNLGMFGIDEFSAVINPPQAAILAVGGGSKRIVPTPYIDGVAVQKKPSIRTIMTARLSADRRVVDEATAALFMSAFKHYITKPELLLL